MAIEDFIKVLGIGQVGLPAIEEQTEEVSMPKVPGRYSLPGDPSLAPPPVETPAVQSLVAGESSGIPQKTGKRSDILSSLSGLMGKTLASEEAPAEAPSAPVEATPYQKQDLMGNYEQQMQEALQDRESRMNQTVGRAAANDISNALMYGMGIDYKIQNTADAELKRMEDLRLKDFNERMGLSGKILGSRKAEQDLQNMGDLNDPNSPITQALRKGAKEYLGGKIDDSVLNSLSGVQLAQLNDELGGVFSKIEDRKFKQEQMNADREERRMRRIAMEKAANERDEDRADAKKDKARADVLKSADSLPKISTAYKRYQEIQPSVEYAKSLKSGDLTPDGVNDGALALQAIKIAQGDTSVVRESDLAQFNKIGGLGQVLADARQAAMGGERLRPEVRNAFINIILDSEKGVRKAAKQQTAGKYNELQKAGIEADYLPGTLRYIHESDDKEDTKGTVKNSYTPEQESGIKYIMDLKKVSRDQAINALTKAGKL